MNASDAETFALQHGSGFAIRMRALDNARRELSAMVSELQHYEDEFSVPQLRAMRKVMAALKNYIKELEV